MELFRDASMILQQWVSNLIEFLKSNLLSEKSSECGGGVGKGDTKEFHDQTCKLFLLSPHEERSSSKLQWELQIDSVKDLPFVLEALKRDKWINFKHQLDLELDDKGCQRCHRC